ncbi:MAG: hypothetical protein KDK99_17135 [Verrucomicrobiales bacterium]|nr:hypothetical protein [Verrucomicrobiales bacterium]
MFEISLSHLILLCMIPGLLTVGGLWLISVWRERSRDRRQRLRVVRCRICGRVYPPETRDVITSCPSCGSANERAPLRMI